MNFCILSNVFKVTPDFISPSFISFAVFTALLPSPSPACTSLRAYHRADEHRAPLSKRRLDEDRSPRPPNRRLRAPSPAKYGHADQAWLRWVSRHRQWPALRRLCRLPNRCRPQPPPHRARAVGRAISTTPTLGAKHLATALQPSLYNPTLSSLFP